MLKSKRRTDTCGFSRGAGGVLDSYTALSREIRAETAPGDKKVVDPLYGKGAEGQIVPRLSVVSGCDRGKVKRFSVNVNRVGGAADAVGKFAPGQQILCRDDVFRHDVPALAHADRRGNVGDICIFKAGQIFAVKGYLPQNRPLSGKTDEGEVIGVCAVVMGEEFGIVEGDAAASAVYAEALPVYPVVLRKVAVFLRPVKYSGKCPPVSGTAGDGYSAVCVAVRTDAAGFYDGFADEAAEFLRVDAGDEIAERHRLVFPGLRVALRVLRTGPD